MTTAAKPSSGRAFVWCSTLALGLVASCAPAAPPSAPAPAPVSRCVLGVPGAQVTVADTEPGIAMSFWAAPDHVDDLRRRAGDAAATHGPGRHLGEGHAGRHDSGAHHGLRAIPLPPMTAVAENVEGGARIVLTPVTPSDRDALRANVRAHVDAMNTSCD